MTRITRRGLAATKMESERKYLLGSSKRNGAPENTDSPPASLEVARSAAKKRENICHR